MASGSSDPASPGLMYRRLVETVSRAGSERSVRSPDGTLSRRGLLTRADRRARELSSMGLCAGQVVALAMGNVPDLLIGLLAASRLGAIAMPVDPALGDRPLVDAVARLPVRMVVRRPRGLAGGGVDYGDHARVRSRRRLAGTLLSVDALDPTRDDPVTLPPGAELVVEARGIAGVARDAIRTGADLAAIGRAAASALSLDDGMPILCTQPLTVPRFFDPVVMGWLASEAQLVMAEGSTPATLLPLARGLSCPVLVDAVRPLLELARAVRAGGGTVQVRPVVQESTAPGQLGRTLRAAFKQPGRQLLLLEEGGVLAHRTLVRGEAWTPADGVALQPGAAMQTGGQEVLMKLAHEVTTAPAVPATHPGALADPPWRHTGYAGRFARDERLMEVLGRDDGLVHLEGRRACLDSIEDVVLAHRRVTEAEAWVAPSADGEPQVHLRYRATGTTELEDLEEHLIGALPPYMVPRHVTRTMDSDGDGDG